MSFFDQEENVTAYIKMTKGYDGKALIKLLGQYAPKNASVLELGIGPGKDLNILKKKYQVTGSDFSQVFVDRYKKRFPTVDVVQLDAVTMRIKRKFDVIYSNKVLQHLSKKDCKQSFANQRERLTKNGILFHSLWYGDKTEKYSGLLFQYYNEKTLTKAIGPGFEILAMERYKEMKRNDSIYVVTRKK